ncbi:MAG: TetR/AcrR family transcriptional regulator [Alphaproteobacteria bacterium]|nr:TetR/AcrR family transcriptional regulator [Alphaproteobacteria bacterium]
MPRPLAITTAADPAEEPSEAKRRGGRPSREAAARLGEQILDVATELFLANGYGATSVEDVARAARISKRTFYHRYADKRELFGAVITRIVERLRPADADALFADHGPLDAALLRLARVILRAALSPQAVALYRVIVAEAARFPDIAAVIAQQGRSQAAAAQIAALLAHHDGAAASAASRDFAAAQFLQMVMAAPLRRALGLGEPMTEAELDAWARNTVALFLNGYRGMRPARA